LDHTTQECHALMQTTRALHPCKFALTVLSEPTNALFRKLPIRRSSLSATQPPSREKRENQNTMEFVASFGVCVPCCLPHSHIGWTHPPLLTIGGAKLHMAKGAVELKDTCQFLLMVIMKKNKMRGTPEISTVLESRAPRISHGTFSRGTTMGERVTEK
jgi:hypothetical protein